MNAFNVFLSIDWNATYVNNTIVLFYFLVRRVRCVVTGNSCTSETFRVPWARDDSVFFDESIIEKK